MNVEVPPPPPTASKLNQIAVQEPEMPARVDNEAKAILDDVALRLQREPDAKAVVVGNFEAGEKNGQKTRRTARRQHQGVPDAGEGNRSESH